MSTPKWRACWRSVGVAALLLGGPAQAEPIAFSEARLVLQFGALYGVAAPPLSEAPLSGTLEATRAGDGSLLGFALPAGLFTADARIALGTPGPYPPARGVDLTFANAAGAFALGTGTGASFGGTMPLAGLHRVCVFFACGDPNATLLDVPLDVVGDGGIASAFQILRVAIAGEAWTTGSVTVDLATATEMITGGISTTEDGAAHVQLVTPLMISTNAVGPNDEDVPPVRGLAQLTLVLAPEPAFAAGLGIAIACLTALGFRRRTGMTS
jgi:hypothetical protein